MAGILGVELDVSKAETDGILIRNKPGRITEVVDAIDTFLQAGCLTSREASRILGRLQYADSFIMGRDGRLAMCELRSNLRADGRKIHLVPEAKGSLSLLKERLMRGEPRRVPCKIDPNPPLVFTDGASEGELHTIGGVIIFGGESQYFGCHVPSAFTKKWLESSKHIIGMVELYGALVARATWDSQLANRKSILFAKEAFVKGTSHSPHYREMLLTLEHLESRNRSWTWVARVPSSSNPADEPSRGVHDGILSELGAELVPCTCPMTGTELQVYYCG